MGPWLVSPARSSPPLPPPARSAPARGPDWAAARLEWARAAGRQAPPPAARIAPPDAPPEQRPREPARPAVQRERLPARRGARWLAPEVRSVLPEPARAAVVVHLGHGAAPASQAARRRGPTAAPPPGAAPHLEPPPAREGPPERPRAEPKAGERMPVAAPPRGLWRARIRAPRARGEAAPPRPWRRSQTRPRGTRYCRPNSGPAHHPPGPWRGPPGTPFRTTGK
jgi:hypothetical protein